MRRLAAPAFGLSALILLSACSQSAVAPDAKVTIGGSFARSDGTVAKSLPVSLMREGDVGEGLAVVTTLGLACKADRRTLSACSHGKDTATDRNGHFQFDLKGSDTQGFLGNAATLELTSVLPRSGEQYDGAAATIRFQVQTTDLTFPLRFWEPAITAGIDSRGGRITWNSDTLAALPRAIPASSMRYDAIFDAPGGERVWTAPSNGTRSTTFDPRVLEDSTGTLAVVGHTQAARVPDTMGRRVDVLLRSGRYAYTGPAGPPQSRGVTCGRQSSSGLVMQSPCGLTDGVFGSAWAAQPAQPHGSSPAAPDTVAIVDIGAAQPLTLLVVRGCDNGCTAALSTDAKQWRTVVNATDSRDFAATIPGRPSARYVRIATNRNIDTLREVSVWGVARFVPPRSILGTSSSALPPIERAIARSGAGLLIAAVAAAMLALGLLGGYALRRRRTNS